MSAMAMFRQLPVKGVIIDWNRLNAVRFRKQFRLRDVTGSPSTGDTAMNTELNFERSSKRRRGFPSETKVKRGFPSGSF